MSGAEIRYTTDGSVPTEATGQVYTIPLSISGTTLIRARAFLSGYSPSPVATSTYIFPDEVVTQDNDYAVARGFPAEWITNEGVNWKEAREGTHPGAWYGFDDSCLLYTSPSPRDQRGSRMPSSA